MAKPIANKKTKMERRVISSNPKSPNEMSCIVLFLAFRKDENAVKYLPRLIVFNHGYHQFVKVV
ncbi:hypothetical protein RRF57_006661 [Xylaria bambusicola]|uniref:Uncharacterized protein n=1 Tax=Xylaria bambusicola TaxID=326684 RepID=A0AAN7UQM7_9PEZI